MRAYIYIYPDATALIGVQLSEGPGVCSPIPKGFEHSAQRCASRATLGSTSWIPLFWKGLNLNAHAPEEFCRATAAPGRTLLRPSTGCQRRLRSIDGPRAEGAVGKVATVMSCERNA